MFFSKTLAALALAALAAAQSSSLKLTNTAFDVRVGEPFKITYSTDQMSEPVTIILRKGDSKSLTTVETITSDATDGSYIWTPKNLPSESDYALEITQGNENNYSKEFAITGGSASSYATTSLSSYPVSGTVTATPYVTSFPISATYNSSMIMTVPANMSTSTHAMASASTGTVSMIRNATFSSATLHATTVTAPASAATTSSSGAASLGTSFTLLFGLLGLVVYLN